MSEIKDKNILIQEINKTLGQDHIIEQHEIEDENYEYEIDEELDYYLDVEYNLQTIFEYIKKVSRNTVFPLFDKLTKYDLSEFLYSDKDNNDKYLF
jgi:hypothetical protein